MTGEAAQRAVELATGRSVRSVHHLASGRSSVAWQVQGSTGVWIARVPIDSSGRRITYQVESLIGRHLAVRGHPVATWTVIEGTGRACSVAPCLSGTAVDPDAGWTDEFAERLASVLADLHAMPARGFGPLADTATEVRGISSTRRCGIVDRWFHTRVWPFDGSALDDHPAVKQARALCDKIASLRERIEAAEAGPIGVVHADLHQEHLLASDHGSLAGVLDFGDAFIGAVAWDFALLNWYYGKRNADLVAAHYPGGTGELFRGCALSIAVGLYKAAKDPTNQAVMPRLRRCVEVADAIGGRAAP